MFGPLCFGHPRSDKLLFLYCYEIVPDIPYYESRAWSISVATVCVSAPRPRHILCIPGICLLRMWHEFGFPNRESVTSPAHYPEKVNLPPLRCIMPRPCLSSLLLLAMRNMGIYIRISTLFARALSGIRVPLHTRSHQALPPTWYLLLISVTTSSGGSSGHTVVTSVVAVVVVVVVSVV